MKNVRWYEWVTTAIADTILVWGIVKSIANWHYLGWESAVVTIFSLLLIFTLINWDLTLLIRDKPTISRRVVDFSQKYPIIVFLIGLLLGVLAGHFFWTMNTTLTDR